MRALLILILSVVGLAAQPTNIDQSTILVKRHAKAKDAEVDEFHGRHLSKVKSFKHLGWQAVTITDARHFEEYQASTLFEKVQWQHLYHLRATYPNDPQISWARDMIQAPQAWDRYATNKTVTVAILDSGIDFNHEDLKDNLWTGPGGEHGYTCTNGVVVPGGEEYWFHGTHVAGIIGATGNNGVGVAGVNWRVKIVSVAIFGPGTAANTTDAINGIEKMVSLKLSGVNIRVANCSWGFSDAEGGQDPALLEAFQLMSNSGIMAVCAGPNGDADAVPDVPSGFAVDGLVAVMASDQYDGKAYFSGWGATAIDIAAPGDSVLSTKWLGGYTTMNGTSMAAGFVSGVAAMLFDINPALTPAQCKAVLLDPGSLDIMSFTTNATHGGRLNFYKCTTNLAKIFPNQTPVLKAPTDLAVAQSGGFLMLTWTDTASGEGAWQIERNSRNSPWTGFKPLASLPGDSRTYVLPATKGQYQFRVRACKDAICSPYSNTVGLRVR